MGLKDRRGQAPRFFRVSLTVDPLPLVAVRTLGTASTFTGAA